MPAYDLSLFYLASQSVEAVRPFRGILYVWKQPILLAVQKRN